MSNARSEIPPAALADLAPTGKLRVAIMYTNPVLASGDPTRGIKGIAVDIAQELGRRVPVPLEIVPFETRVALLKGEWDVAFSSYDPERTTISCTAPLVETEGTYLVPADSKVRAIADIDSEGVVIAVAAQSALDLHLIRNIKHARIERIPGAHGAADLLIAGKVNALAGVRQQVMRVAAKVPGSRILDGRFMAISQALAMPAGREAGMRFLRAFVEDIKASGVVARIIEKNGIKGVAVSPAAVS